MNIKSEPVFENKYFFFFLVMVFLIFFGQWGQPTIFGFFDSLAAREAGLSLATSDDYILNMKRLYWGALAYRHGPIPYLIQNISYWLLGKSFPMVHSILQVPHIPILLCSAWIAWKIGVRLGLGRHAWLVPFSLLLQGTVLTNMRTINYEMTLSVLVQLVIIYLLLKAMQNQSSLLEKMAIPILLSIYPHIGADWPLFLLITGLIVACSENRKAILLNRFNLIWVGSLTIYSVIIYQHFFHGSDIFPQLTLPFDKIFGILSNSIVVGEKSLTPWMIWNSFSGLGFLALMWVPIQFARKKTTFNCGKTSSHHGALAEGAPPVMGFLTAIFVWCLVIIIMTMRLNSIYYGIFGTVPVAILAAVFLHSIQRRWTVLLIIVCMIPHILFIFSSELPGTPFSTLKDDLRVPAIAAFINQNHPDFLTQDKVAFLPNYISAGAGYNIRGRYKRVIMQSYFPESRTRLGSPKDDANGRTYLGDRNGSPDYVLNDFMDNYLNKGKISANWLLLVPEHFQGSSGWFFEKLLHDPQIKWVAELYDTSGRKIWLGEVTHQGQLVENAPRYSVEEYAKLFIDRYFYINFMSKDWGYFQRY
ncbi:MAG: hypothetical protein HQL55_10805 [Magnetococcales bacterium]|nr:hypothetical protein [Magnetococcales bacterium]